MRMDAGGGKQLARMRPRPPQPGPGGGPTRSRADEGQSCVARHQDWIARQRRRASLLPHEFPPDRLELKAIGETWHCQPVRGPAPIARAGLADATVGGRLLRELAPCSGGGVLELATGADGNALRTALLAWLGARAPAALAPRLAAPGSPR